MKKLILFLLLIPSVVLAQVKPDTAVKIQTSTTTLSSTPSIETSAYAPGDLIGELITLTEAVRVDVNSGIVSSIQITDLDSESIDIDVVVFGANPSATTFTDNAALDIADADLTKVVCVASVTDYYAFADNSVGIANNINCPFKISGTTLYAALVARSAVTYTSASDLKLFINILQD